MATAYNGPDAIVFFHIFTLPLRTNAFFVRCRLFNVFFALLGRAVLLVMHIYSTDCQLRWEIFKTLIANIRISSSFPSILELIFVTV